MKPRIHEIHSPTHITVCVPVDWSPNKIVNFGRLECPLTVVYPVNPPDWRLRTAQVIRGLAQTGMGASAVLQQIIPWEPCPEREGCLHTGLIAVWPDEGPGDAQPIVKLGPEPADINDF